MHFSCDSQCGKSINLLNYFIKISELELNAVRFTLRFPFDTNNPIGYLFAFCLQYFIVNCFAFFATNLLSTLVGSFLIGIALTNDMKNDPKLMNNFAKMRKNRLQTMRQKIYDFVEFNSTVKQLSNFV